MEHFAKGRWVDEDPIAGLEDCIRLFKKINATLILNDAIREATKEMEKSSVQVMKDVSEVYYRTGMMPPKPYIRPPLSGSRK